MQWFHAFIANSISHTTHCSLGSFSIQATQTEYKCEVTWVISPYCFTKLVLLK